MFRKRTRTLSCLALEQDSMFLLVGYHLWNMSLDCYVFLRTSSKLNTSVEGTGKVQTTNFLNKEIGANCMARLLGIGSTRLRKSMNLTPDLRYGQSKSGSSKDTWSIDAFFTTLHESVAETLPDRPRNLETKNMRCFRTAFSLVFIHCPLFLWWLPWRRFIRRGRAARGDDADFDVSASDIDDGELTTWLEKPGKSMALQILQSQDQKKLTKFLPPGTLIELYQHYTATRQLLGAHVSSSSPKLFKAEGIFSEACASSMYVSNQ